MLISCLEPYFQTLVDNNTVQLNRVIIKWTPYKFKFNLNLMKFYAFYVSLNYVNVPCVFKKWMMQIYDAPIESWHSALMSRNKFCLANGCSI